MSPVTHFFAGWVLACASPIALTRRERALVVSAAVAPDVDGLGAIPELLTRGSSHPVLWFSEYHHALHTLAFAILCTLGAFLGAGPLAKRRKRSGESGSSAAKQNSPLQCAKPGHPGITAFLVFVSFHLHLLCDLAGARGPDGYQWPIPYLRPFSNVLQFTWHGQWALNAWQNFALTGFLLLATLACVSKVGATPLQLVSRRWDAEVVKAVQKRSHVHKGKQQG